MIGNAKAIARNIVRKLGFDIMRANNDASRFHSNHYLRHNARRLEHLASLSIPVAGMTVLEVGAGVGDHSHYYIDRKCRMTITEVRPENLRYLEQRFPRLDVQHLDIECPVLPQGVPFDIVHCYGLLYHLHNPCQALEFLSRCCKKTLLLETCVSFGDAKEINKVTEERSNRTQAYSGIGCRPTRPWVFEKLQELFDYVYLPKSQPNHEEFPVDWTDQEEHLRQCPLSRAVFVACREKMDNEMLTSSLMYHQTRQI